MNKICAAFATIPALLPAVAFAQDENVLAEALPQGAPDPEAWFVYLIIIIVLAGTLIALLIIRGSLASSGWSIADALSEEGDVTLTDTDGRPEMGADGKPIMVTKMVASSSRMIALMGLIAILLLFLAFGVFILYDFAYTGTVPDDVDKIVNFLLAGLTLFAPYLVNKFASVFGGLGAPGK